MITIWWDRDQSMMNWPKTMFCGEGLVNSAVNHDMQVYVGKWLLDKVVGLAKLDLIRTLLFICSMYVSAYVSCKQP